MAAGRTESGDPLVKVVLEKISKRFARQVALVRINVSLTRGRVCVIMGENGAGKSTLLSIISTELAPDEGTIRYETATGRGLVGRELRSRLGYVSHQPMVYPELSALENVTFFARIGGVKRATREAEEILERLGLDPRSTKPAAAFSRGMQARLAAARALVTRPELLLLDEATSGLDQEGRRALLDILAQAAPDRIVVVVTHQLSTAAELAAQLVVLRRGRLALQEDLADQTTAERRARIQELLDTPRISWHGAMA
jgi:ABC-type multidrug transport system ATPase subunit